MVLFPAQRSKNHWTRIPERATDVWPIWGQNTSGLGSRSTCKAFCSLHGGTSCAEGVSSWEELPSDENGDLLGDTQ